MVRRVSYTGGGSTSSSQWAPANASTVGGVLAQLGGRTTHILMLEEAVPHAGEADARTLHSLTGGMPLSPSSVAAISPAEVGTGARRGTFSAHVYVSGDNVTAALHVDEGDVVVLQLLGQKWRAAQGHTHTGSI